MPEFYLNFIFSSIPIVGFHMSDVHVGFRRDLFSCNLVFNDENLFFESNTFKHRERASTKKKRIKNKSVCTVVACLCRLSPFILPAIRMVNK